MLTAHGARQTLANGWQTANDWAKQQPHSTNVPHTSAAAGHQPVRATEQSEAAHGAYGERGTTPGLSLSRPISHQKLSDFWSFGECVSCVLFSRFPGDAKALVSLYTALQNVAFYTSPEYEWALPYYVLP